VQRLAEAVLHAEVGGDRPVAGLRDVLAGEHGEHAGRNRTVADGHRTVNGIERDLRCQYRQRR